MPLLGKEISLRSWVAEIVVGSHKRVYNQHLQELSKRNKEEDMIDFFFSQYFTSNINKWNGKKREEEEEKQTWQALNWFSSINSQVKKPMLLIRRVGMYSFYIGNRKENASIDLYKKREKITHKKKSRNWISFKEAIFFFY